MSARSRHSRPQSQTRNRKPRLDSSRAPKPGRPRFTSNSRQERAAANSVFANAPVKKPKKVVDADDPLAEELGHRLQKVLAAAGYGSRRKCEELIADGRVEVDGVVVTELGVRVFPQEQRIRVDGEALPKAKPIYLALNKPKNTLCTNSDPQGRRRVLDFIPEQFGRLFPVGRLDQNSEGLIILTNDGALAERLTHPRFEAPKKYKVQVAGLVDYELARDLKRGVHIAEGIVQADDVVIKSRHKMSSVLEITLTEGKNREIRRMLARLGHKVMQLQRVQVGSIKLGKMAPGEFRRLNPKEVAELYRTARTPNDAASPKPRLRPIEISEIEMRNAPETEDEKRSKTVKNSNVANADSAAETTPRRRQFDPSFERFAEPSRRREANPDFREEFRSEERRERRRRVREEFDDEERTIGPRKFDRSEREGGRDRFNADASERRGGTKKRFGDKPSFNANRKSGGDFRGGSKRGFGPKRGR
ncbi:MAG: rRNA pseudouridine synthase [Thermoguttaceae bacterium]|nr:rRNA pseudouridine synthase [Thermoguttaceae bacterium]MBQ7029016.1 rRNA pseudouridine synthase [Thermoguttaceae bacterium]